MATLGVACDSDSTEGEQEGVTLVAHSLTPDSPAYLCKLIGTARNDNGSDLDSVTIEVDFKDEGGVVVATAKATITDFEAGGHRDFEVRCPIDDWHASD
jgi:hypothetical protein